MAEKTSATEQKSVDMSVKGHHGRATKAVTNLEQILANAHGLPSPVTAAMWSGFLDDIRRLLALTDPNRDKVKDATTDSDGKKKTMPKKPARKRGAKVKDGAA